MSFILEDNLDNPKGLKNPTKLTRTKSQQIIINLSDLSTDSNIEFTSNSISDIFKKETHDGLEGSSRKSSLSEYTYQKYFFLFMDIVKKTELKHIFSFMSCNNAISVRMDFFDNIPENILIILKEFLSSKNFESYVEKPRKLEDIYLNNDTVLNKVKEIIFIHTPRKIIQEDNEFGKIDDISDELSTQAYESKGSKTESSGDFSTQRSYQVSINLTPEHDEEEL